MKKTMILLLSISLFTFLAGCREDEEIEDIIDDVVDCVLNPEHDDCIDDIIDYEALLSEAMTGLNLIGTTALYDDIDLPLTALNDVTITWETSNEQYLSNTGVVTTPWFDDGDQIVTLTATLVLNEFSLEKEFSVLVKAYESEAFSDLLFDISSFDLTGNVGLETDILLPNSFLEDIVITWETTYKEVVTSDGEVIRPSFEEGDQDIEMIATFSRGDESIEKSFYVNVLSIAQNVVERSVNFDFENLADEYIVPDSDIDIFYLEDGELPYVDIIDFIELIDGAIVSDELLISIDDDILTITILIEDEDELIESYELDVVFDFTKNDLIVDNFDFFASFSEEIQTDFGSGLEVVDYIFNEPDVTTINFDYYDFDIIKTDSNYLIPFHIANLLFSGGMYDVYYNGDMLYGIDTYQLMGDSSIQSILLDSDSNFDSIPYDVKLATFDYLTFVFDYFYGLKEEREIDSFYDYFKQYESSITTEEATDRDLYREIRELILEMDDLHTSHIFTGYYEYNYSIPTYVEDLGTNSQAYYDVYFDLQDTCASRPAVYYLEDNTIAIIYIAGYEAETPDEIALILAEIEALGTVTDIVMDLSCNGGGIIGSLIQILGFMTDEPIPISSMTTSDNSSGTAYYSTENVALDVNWYIKTSTLTFSAANLMTSIAKDMGIATIIGQQSSGGACSLAAILTPDGSAVLISSNTMLTDIDFDSIEGGIVVDYYMSYVFSNEQLINIINTVNSD